MYKRLAKSDGRVGRYILGKYLRIEFVELDRIRQIPRVPSIQFNLWAPSDNDDDFHQESDEELKWRLEYYGILQRENEAAQATSDQGTL